MLGRGQQCHTMTMSAPAWCPVDQAKESAGTGASERPEAPREDEADEGVGRVQQHAVVPRHVAGRDQRRGVAHDEEEGCCREDDAQAEAQGAPCDQKGTCGPSACTATRPDMCARERMLTISAVCMGVNVERQGTP